MSVCGERTRAGSPGLPGEPLHALARWVATPILHTAPPPRPPAPPVHTHANIRSLNTFIIVRRGRWDLVQRSRCCGRRMGIYFCIAMAGGVYLTVFLPGYVYEAPERRQIKSIYLHSAFLQVLDLLNLQGPGSPDWEVGGGGGGELGVAGVGGQDPRVEVTPRASLSGTRSRPAARVHCSPPRWIHTCLPGLLPIAGVQDGVEAAGEAAVGAVRMEGALLLRLSPPGGWGQDRRPPPAPEDPPTPCPSWWRVGRRLSRQWKTRAGQLGG